MEKQIYATTASYDLITSDIWDRNVHDTIIMVTLFMLFVYFIFFSLGHLLEDVLAEWFKI